MDAEDSAMTLQDVGLPDAAVDELAAWFESQFVPRFEYLQITERAFSEARTMLTQHMRALLARNRLPADLLLPVIHLDEETGDMFVGWSMNRDHLN